MTQTLLADIGGTYARFWTWENGQARSPEVYFQDLSMPMEQLIQLYLDKTGICPTTFIAGAAGCLRPKGILHLTNRDLIVDMPQLCRHFGFEQGVLANDMVFHAISVQNIPDSTNACVVVIGTGMGCSYIRDNQIQASEDGHARMTFSCPELGDMTAQCWEDLLSGPAFLRLYQHLDSTHKPVMQSREVSFLAHNTHDKNALLTYRIMAQALAAFCLKTATEKNVPVFYLGGLSVELLRSKQTLQIFFDALGKFADILSIRIIKPSDQSALVGLETVAKTIEAKQKITCIRPKDFYHFKQR